MMNKIKDFNVLRLRRSMYKDRKKQQLLEIIVYYATKFYPSSILNQPLLIYPHFSEEIIQSVLSDDLGYNLLVCEKSKNSGISGLINGSSSIIVLSKRVDS